MNERAEKLDRPIAEAVEACAELAWSDEEDRPWEDWAESRDFQVAQLVAQDIAAAIRARGEGE